MKRIFLPLLSLTILAGVTGCSFKVTRPMLQMLVSGTNKVSTEPAYADSLEKQLSVPYVENGTSEQVMDIYYAAPEVRKDAVLIDIHGGFYVAGKRENNRRFASVFLREGYDLQIGKILYSFTDFEQRFQSKTGRIRRIGMGAQEHGSVRDFPFNDFHSMPDRFFFVQHGRGVFAPDGDSFHQRAAHVVAGLSYAERGVKMQMRIAERRSDKVCFSVDDFRVLHFESRSDPLELPVLDQDIPDLTGPKSGVFDQ